MHREVFLDILNVHSTLFKNDLTFISDTDIQCVEVNELLSSSKKMAEDLGYYQACGERALILCRPGIYYIQIVLACFYAGIIPVPLYPHRKKDRYQRVEAIIYDCSPSICFIDSEVERSELSTIIKDADIVSPNQALKIRDKVIQETQNEVADVAFLQYTSGSTSIPKGVVVTFECLSSNLRALNEKSKCDQSDIFCSWLPLYHDLGLVASVFLPLYVGADLILMSSDYFLKKPIRWLECISKYRATVSGAPDFAYLHCCESIDTELCNLQLDSWRLAFTAAEPINIETIQLFTDKFSAFGFRRDSFFPAYGLAEFTVFAASIETHEPLTAKSFSIIGLDKLIATEPISKHDLRNIVCCGRPARKHDIIIMGLDTKLEVKDGEIGEIGLAGPSLCPRYWNRQLDRVYVNIDGSRKEFLKTGDVGFIVDGGLYVCGRINDTIICNGRNIFFNDIELTAKRELRKPNLQCAAIEVDNQIVLIAEHESHEGNEVDALSKNLANVIFKDYTVPVKEVMFVRRAQIPKTSSGKIRRNELKSQYLSKKLKTFSDGKITVETNNEKMPSKHGALGSSVITYLQSKNDGVFVVSFEKSLAENGGSSLDAFKISQIIKELANVDYDPASIISSPSIGKTLDDVHKINAAHQHNEQKIPFQIHSIFHDSASNTAPLSSQQSQLWLLNKVSGNLIPYNIFARVCLKGRVDVTALLNAFKAIIDRHSILRTVYRQDERGLPKQVILEESVVCQLLDKVFKVESISDIEHDQSDDLFLTRFDLENDIPIKARVCTRSTGDALLSIVFCHIATDGWSLGIIIKELEKLYQSNIQGGCNPLSPLTIQYADYARWQNEWMPKSRQDEQLSYWRKKLEGAPIIHSLPLDSARPSSQSFCGSFVKTRISSIDAAAFKRLCRTFGVTLFTGLYSVLNILLSRYNNWDEVVIGTPAANRDQHEVENLVGFFVNTVILRTALTNELSFEKLLQVSKNTVLEAFSNKDVPFQQVVDIMQPERSLSYSPLCQIMFVLRDDYEQKFNLPNIVTTFLDVESRLSKFDLTLSILETKDGLTLDWEYSTDIFHQRTIKQISQHFNKLIEQVTKHPQDDIKKLELLADDEKHALINRLSRCNDYKQQNLCLHEMFEMQASVRPQAIAVVYRDSSITYGELNNQSERLAFHLVNRYGVSPEMVVGIYLDRSISMIVALLGVLKAGGAYVPIDIEEPSTRLGEICHQAGLSLILVSDASSAKLNVVDARVVNVDSECWSDSNTPIDRSTFVKAQPHNLAYVIFTSGTTGTPKGVMIEHRSIVNLISWVNEQFQVTHNDVLLALTSITFDLSVYDIFGVLSAGGRIVLVDKDVVHKPQEIWNIVLDQGVTFWDSVPTTLNALSSHIQKHRAAKMASSLRIVFLSGDWIPTSLPTKMRNFFPKASIYSLGGATEAAVWSNFYAIDRDMSGCKSIPYGKPIANTSFVILDENLNLCPVGVPGELHIGGVGLARGYINDRRRTQERFINNPFQYINPGIERLYKTGDMGRLLADGNMEFLGRSDCQVKVRGFRVEIGEIEAAIKKSTLVEDCVVKVFGYPHDGQDQQIVAFVTLTKRSDSCDEIQELLEANAQAHLPGYMVPSHFQVIDFIPLTVNGKIDKKALSNPSVKSRQKKYRAPRNKIEELFCVIWANLLNAEQIGIDDNFFQLGGHSLLIVRFLSELNRAGYTVTVRDVFQNPSIAEIVRFAKPYELKGFEVPDNLIQDSCERITPDLLTMIELDQTDINSIVDKTPGGCKNIQDIYPLTPLQEGILVHSLGRKDPYILSSLIKIKSEDVSTLVNILNKITAATDILRTSIVNTRLSGYVQVVSRHAEIKLQEFSLDGASSIENALEASILGGADRMDIGSAPLLRLHLLKGEEDSYIIINLHHIISDHVSLEILNDHVRTIYKGGLEYLPQQIPSRVYSAYANQEAESGLASQYFITLLESFDTPSLPFNNSNIHCDGSDISDVTATLPAEMCTEIDLISVRQKVSHAAILHLAFAVVVSFCSNKQDVVFGTVVSGRTRGLAGRDSALGLFINTLPIRILLDDRSIVKALQDINHMLNEVVEHEFFPLSKVQKLCQLPGNSPLFSAVFNYRVTKPTSVSSEEQSLFREIKVFERSNYPFLISADHFGSEIHIKTQIHSSINAHDISDYFIHSVKVILDNIRENSDFSINSVSPLNDKHIRQLQWIGDGDQALKRRSISDLFTSAVALNPFERAVVDRQKSITYSELDDLSNRIAYFIKRKCRGSAASTIAVWSSRSTDAIAVVLAIVKTGNVLVGIDAGTDPIDVAVILNKAEVSITFTDYNVKDLDDSLKLKHELLEIDSVINDLSRSIHHSDTPAERDGQPSAAIYIVNTSGTTGVSKSILMSRRSSVNLINWHIGDMQDCNVKRVLQFARLDFDVSFQEIFTTICAGATLYTIDDDLRSNFYLLTQFILLHKIERIFMPYSALECFLYVVNTLDVDVAFIRELITGGEQLKYTESFQKFFARNPSCRLFNQYGPSETHLITCKLVHPSHSEIDYLPSVGRPISNTQLFVCNKNMQLLPKGVEGELYIGGDSVSIGYLANDLRNAQHYVENPFLSNSCTRLYKSGDIVIWNDQDELEFIARGDDLVKIRGFSVKLSEIDRCIQSLSEVRESVVIKGADSSGQDFIVAYFVPSDNAVGLNEAYSRKIRKQLSEYLPDYMIPRYVLRLDMIPTTKNGKVDIRALPLPISLDTERPDISDMTPTQLFLCELIRVILNNPGVGSYDNLFDIGLHSLLVMKIIAEISDKYGVRITPEFIFSHPSVAAISERIDNFGLNEVDDCLVEEGFL